MAAAHLDCRGVTAGPALPLILVAGRWDRGECTRMHVPGRGLLSPLVRRTSQAGQIGMPRSPVSRNIVRHLALPQRFQDERARNLMFACCTQRPCYLPHYAANVPTCWAAVHLPATIVLLQPGWGLSCQACRAVLSAVKHTNYSPSSVQIWSAHGDGWVHLLSPAVRCEFGTRQAAGAEQDQGVAASSGADLCTQLLNSANIEQ